MNSSFIVFYIIKDQRQKALLTLMTAVKEKRTLFCDEDGRGMDRGANLQLGRKNVERKGDVVDSFAISSISFYH